MNGTDATTGKRLDGRAHLSQSIADIVMTPLGTRLMSHDYGSLLPELIDQPFNATTRLRMCGAIVSALQRWEPRIRTTHISLTAGTTPGAAVLELEGELTSSHTPGEYTRLTIPLSRN